MRIGELADMLGLSTRAVRHYHRRGLLPEPARRPNGYREERELLALLDTTDQERAALLDAVGLAQAEVLRLVADGVGERPTS